MTKPRPETASADSVGPLAVRCTGSTCRPGRPPWLHLAVDVVLTNRGAAHAWFLLPRSAKPAAVEGRTVYAVRGYRLRGEGRLAIAVLDGSGGGHAVQVPPAGEVRLLGVPVEVLRGDDDAETVRLELLAAGELEVDGVPLARWLDADLHCTAGAAARYDLDAAEHLATRRRDDLSEVPLRLDGARRFNLEVRLD